MRYQTSAKGETTFLAGDLPTGKIVTIALYNLSNGSAVTLSNNSCSEIGSTGLYRWASSNIATQPTVKTEYVYIMTAATSGEKSRGKFVLGGYVDEIDAAVSSRSSHGDPDPSGHLDAAISSRSVFDPSTDPVDLNPNQSGVAIGTCGSNADMRGTDDAALASALTALADIIDDIKGKTENLPDDTGTELKICQALLGKNIKLTDTAYDDSHNMTAGTLTGYASKEDLEANEGAGQNPLFVIELSGTYSGPAEATSYIKKDA